MYLDEYFIQKGFCGINWLRARKMSQTLAYIKSVFKDIMLTIQKHILTFHKKNCWSQVIKLICTSAKEVLEEYLRNHQNIKRNVEDRLVYL